MKRPIAIAFAALMLAATALAADAPCPPCPAIRHCPPGTRCRPEPQPCPPQATCPPAPACPACSPCLAEEDCPDPQPCPECPATPIVPPGPSQAPIAPSGRWVLPLTALYLHGEPAAGVGLGRRFANGWELLGQILGGPAVECDGISHVLSADDSDDHEAHGGYGHPKRPVRVDCEGCESSRYGGAITLVIPLGRR